MPFFSEVVNLKTLLLLLLQAATLISGLTSVTCKQERGSPEEESPNARGIVVVEFTAASNELVVAASAFPLPEQLEDVGRTGIL